ncbi:uncharacterized [Tachysurus ichikawai]
MPQQRSTKLEQTQALSPSILFPDHLPEVRLELNAHYRCKTLPEPVTQLSFQTQVATKRPKKIVSPLQRAGRQVRVNAVQAEQPRVFSPRIKKDATGSYTPSCFTPIKWNINRRL